jgi:hypothetical protein
MHYCNTSFTTTVTHRSTLRNPVYDNTFLSKAQLLERLIENLQRLTGIRCEWSINLDQISDYFTDTSLLLWYTDINMIHWVNSVLIKAVPFLNIRKWNYYTALNQCVLQALLRTYYGSFISVRVIIKTLTFFEGDSSSLTVGKNP